MPRVKDNEHNSLPHFNRVHFVLDHNSSTCIQPRGVVKLPSENPLEETVYFFPIRKQMLMFSCLGMEPCFYFPFSMPEPPSDLNLCMLVCIAAVSFCSCVHQFLCFLGIFCYIWPWVSFCLLFWLPQLPDTWGKVFTKLSNWNWVLQNFTLPLHCCKTPG